MTWHTQQEGRETEATTSFPVVLSETIRCETYLCTQVVLKFENTLPKPHSSPGWEHMFTLTRCLRSCSGFMNWNSPVLFPAYLGVIYLGASEQMFSFI